MTMRMVKGLGSSLPLGMARSEPPIPMGTIGAPVRAEQEGRPFHEVLDHPPLAPGAFWEQHEALAAVEDLFGALEGLAIGRFTDGPGKAPT